MTKFYGAVGYISAVETSPGVYDEVATVQHYYGDVTKNMANIQSSEVLNDNFKVNNTISIIADAYALENFSSIRYVEWMGVEWKVTSVEVRNPRLILYIGEVYNGLKA